MKNGFYNSEDENDETNHVITQKIMKINKLNHKEESSKISGKTGIRSAVMWSNSNGKESITVICHPGTEADSI